MLALPASSIWSVAPELVPGTVLLGTQAALAPLGSPATLRFTAPLKPPVRLTLTL